MGRHCCLLQAAVAVTVSIRRRRRQLLALIGRRKSVQECELRRVLGNTPDTSKALRWATACLQACS